MRWDLPEWEHDRLRQTIDAKVHLDENDLEWIDATAEREVPELPDVISPQSNGICSSGSTGLPKVIVSNRPGVYDPLLTTPFAEQWGRLIPRPQTVLVLGPMYHLNGFYGLLNLIGGDRLVVLESFDASRAVGAIEKHRVSTFYCTPTMLKRMAALPGKIGDIYMRSPLYGGSTYLGAGQPKMTAEGLCTVGDAGYLDEDGFLYLVDRRVDLIITGGANVYPAEVEIALMDHPKVADVVVVGLKDEEWGRRVHAIIEPADAADPPTFDDVRAWAKARLSTYKVPKSIEIVDTVPRSAATKVNRGALVEARGG